MLTIYAKDQDGHTHVFNYPVVPPPGTIFRAEGYILVVKGYPLIEIVETGEGEGYSAYAAYSPDAQPEWPVNLYVARRSNEETNEEPPPEG